MASESFTLQAETRAQLGTRAAQRLREQGRLPAIIYGHQQTPRSVSVLNEEIESAIRHHSRVFDLVTNGETEKVVIRELQWNHLGTEMLHVDFLRISAHERIEIRAPVITKGEAPGVGADGILDVAMHELHVECPAIAQPDGIVVDISNLQKGQAIHVKELTLPEGVRVLDDPDLVVVQVALPRGESAEESTDTEPEVMARGKKDKEEE